LDFLPSVKSNKVNNVAVYEKLCDYMGIFVQLSNKIYTTKQNNNTIIAMDASN
jgi:hypothetical protein